MHTASSSCLFSNFTLLLKAITCSLNSAANVLLSSAWVLASWYNLCNLRTSAAKSLDLRCSASNSVSSSRSCNSFIVV